MRLLLDINILLHIAFERPGEAASSALVSFVITRNERDFLSSPVAALSPEMFFAQFPVT